MPFAFSSIFHPLARAESRSLPGQLRRGMQDELLIAPVCTLARHNLIFVSVIDFVHGHEFLQLFPTGAELAQGAPTPIQATRGVRLLSNT